jgi:tetratricopeptide (TPR) repeat protein
VPARHLGGDLDRGAPALGRTQAVVVEALDGRIDARARICGVDQAALSARTLRRDTHMLASDILMRLDRPTEALAHLDEALEIDPDRPDALGRRAELRLRQGDHEGAIADLDTFLRLSPLPYEHPDVRKAYELRASAESARHARTRAASATP